MPEKCYWLRLGICLAIWNLAFDMPRSALAEPNSQANVDRPNILFLFSDDQRADTIAALGNSVIQTPHLDQLVRRGLSFNQAYMQGSMNAATCVASRAMLLTGRSVFRIHDHLQNQDTWPAAFARAGYTTFATGKWHNGDKSLVANFQLAKGIFSGGMVNPLHAPLRDLINGELAKPQASKKHSCEIFADETIQFLQQPHEQPFFCYVPFNGPHDPHIVPEDFAVRYDAANMPLPPNFLPKHPFDNGEMNIRDEKLLPLPRTESDVKQMVADYYRYISFVDHQVGRILVALKQSPHARNTIVVFSADSGVARGSHGLIGKQNLYEHSLCVPLIIAGPGIVENQQTSALCYLFDVLPTLGQLCRVEPPQGNEGQAFTPVLSHCEQPGRTELFFAYKNVQRAVRRDEWKLIHYPAANRTQLFNLSKDPQETTNLADSPDSQERVSQLKRDLQGLQQRYGDELRNSPHGKKKS